VQMLYLRYKYVGRIVRVCLVDLNIYSTITSIFGQLRFFVSKYPGNIQATVCTCSDYETNTLWRLALISL
jgi:hypothetical protein